MLDQRRGWADVVQMVCVCWVNKAKVLEKNQEIRSYSDETGTRELISRFNNGCLIFTTLVCTSHLPLLLVFGHVTSRSY